MIDPVGVASKLPMYLRAKKLLISFNSDHSITVPIINRIPFYSLLFGSDFPERIAFNQKSRP